MEAATAQTTDLNFNLNSDPTLFMDGINYLDPENPIDRLLVDYKEDLAKDTFPTAAQQRKLIAGLKCGHLQSVRELVDSHRGLVAAVAYPFKAGEANAEDLLQEGVHALVMAAKTYDREEPADFSDYAAATIHAAFSGLLPELAGDSYVELQDHPMEGIYKFMETVRPADTPAKMRKMREQTEDRETARLEPDEIKTLQLLHLSAPEICTIMDVRPYKVDALTASIKSKLQVETREAAALAAFRGGVQYDVLDIPGREHFTVDERLVAMRLGRRNADIAEELGFSQKKILDLGTSLRSKTQARSRAEIAIMAHLHDFEPTEEEMNPPSPSLLEQLSPLQKKVLERILYKQDKDLAEEPDIGLSEKGISCMVNRISEKAGVKIGARHRAALILELHRQGMQFDVVQPAEPISELLYAHELEIAKLVHLPYETISEMLDLGATVERIGEMVNQAKKKIGARSRQELALMMEMFYDGSEALEKDSNTNEWRLARHLGLKALAACDIDKLLTVTTDRQREAITAYYLAEGPPIWREACQELGIEVTTARKAAAAGIARMVQKLRSESAQPVPEFSGA